MAEKKVIELEVKTNTASLKAQLREAQNEVNALSEKFGATSDQAINAAKNAAKLKDAIGDAKALTDAFNPDAKFNALSSSIGGVLNGFQAFEGALGLVGVEGEAVQQTLLKVQSAMALSQGLQGLGEARDSFKQLGAVASNALKGIKTGLAATGIGLFVVALGLVVAYWDDIKAAVSGVSEEQKKLNEDAQKNLDVQKAKLTAIDSQENILKLQGKSEREILNIKIAQTNEVINATKQQLLNNEKTAIAQIEASKRNKEILSGILQFISLPLSLILRTIDDAGKLLGKDFGLNEKLYGGISGMLFDPEETKREIAAVRVETEKGLKQLENTRAGFQLQIKAIDKTAAEEAKNIRQQNQKDEEEAAKKKREADLKLLEDLSDDMEASRRKRLDKQAEEQKKAADVELALVNEKINKQIELDNLATENKKKNAEIEKQIADGQFQVARDSFNAIANLAQAFGGNSEREQKKAFEIQKAANIAGAVMDTYKAATGAYASMASIPVAGPALGIAAAAAAVGAGLANVKNISSQKFGGSAVVSNVTSGMGNNNQVITPNFNIIGNQNQTQLAQLNQAPIKAYVVGSDVTTQQMLDKKKVQNATL
ncbi:hypothetical protein EB001_06910 [bacterium]|nr:hypothetical protein [bacterium]